MVDPQEPAETSHSSLVVSYGSRSATAFGTYVAYSVAQLQIRVRALFFLWALDVSTPRRTHLLADPLDPVLSPHADWFARPSAFTSTPQPSRQRAPRSAQPDRRRAQVLYDHLHPPAAHRALFVEPADADMTSSSEDEENRYDYVNGKSDDRQWADELIPYIRKKYHASVPR